MRSAAIRSCQDTRSAFSRELENSRSARSLSELLTVSLRSLVFVLAVILPSALAFAQLPSETDVTSTPTPNAGHDYIRSLAETVNPANGSLSIRIGVPMPPSRGFTVPFNFAYDSNGAFYLHSPCVGCDGFEWWTTNSMLSQGGWSYSVPMLSVETSSFVMQTLSPTDVPGTFTCQARTDFVMQDVAGDRHNLGISYVNPNPACTTGGPDSQVTVATVGQYLTQTTPQWTGQGNNDPGATYPLTVTNGDGMVYSFPQAGAPPTGYHCATCRPITYPPNFITDRNGNQFTISYTPGSPTTPSLTYTDTVGRQAVSIPTFGASPDLITVSGLGQPYKVSWEPVQASFSISMSQLSGNDPSCSSLSPGSQPPINVISSVVLPDGQAYTFEYDPVYGLIKKITYPSGGYVSYVWGVNPQSEYGLWQKTLSNGSAGFCAYHYDTPAIQKRLVSFDGTTVALEQDFDLASSPYTTCWGNSSCTGGDQEYWDHKTTTVVTKDLLRGTQYSTVYTYGWTGADEQANTSIGITTQIPVEKTVQYQDTNGAVLNTVAKQWYNERLIRQQATTLPGNLVSESDWSYNQNEMMTEKDDYDYGHGARGPLLRKTITPAYQTFSQNNAPVHIVDKPTEVKLQDSTGTVVGGVGYTYCGSPNSDGSCAPPGNLISRSDWVSGDGGTTVTTSYNYDSYGNLINATDPAHNVTTFTYGGLDSCGFSNPASAYLIGIAYPTVSGVSLRKSFSYNCASGSLASATDENGRSTSYLYNDPFGRLTETDGPPDPNNGGSHPTTQTCYNDANPNPTVTTSVLMNTQTGPASCYGTTGTWKTTVNEMDGLGHTIWNETTSGPQGTIYVKTTYDGNGNVWTTSNPSYSQASLTNTTFTYDSLGRKTQEIFADSTARQWCYDGVASQGQTNCLPNKATETTPNLANLSWIDQSDENGNHTQQISDGLGRLAAVMEPNASDIPAMETDYNYDALGNLVQVDQWGGPYGSAGDRQRVFVYDGLSRLITSYNPESGVTGYAYLASGANCAGDPSLPCSKTDARGITRHYQYDAVNRLTDKYYTGDPNGTPTSCYQYGSSSSQNTVGRLAAEYTQKYTSVDCSAAPAGGYLTLRSILSYDTAGHMTEEQQCSPGGCVTGGPYDLAYKYDLAGELTYSTNGISSTPGASSGPLAFTDTYDAVGNLSSVGSSWSDATHPGCLFVAQVQAGATATCTEVVASPYEPFGALWNAEYGTGLVITKSYDPIRMRFSGESDIGTLIQGATPATATITISGAEQSLQSQQ